MQIAGDGHLERGDRQIDPIPQPSSAAIPTAALIDSTPNEVASDATIGGSSWARSRKPRVTSALMAANASPLPMMNMKIRSTLTRPSVCASIASDAVAVTE
jgi:hypothetical protein